MGRDITRNLKTTGPHHVLLTGHFHPDTANPPTGLVGDGFASIVRDAQGEYTLTLKEAYYGCEWSSAHLAMNAATDSVAQIGAIDPAAKTVKIHLLTAGAAADIAAHAANAVNVSLMMLQSDLG